MRLLSKQETAQKLTEDRRMAIDEGIGFARKVDALRQTALKEEASLGTFRETTTAEVVAALAELLQTKTDLERDVASLMEDCNTALVPLEQKEKEVQASMEVLAAKQEELTTREDILKSKEQDYDKRNAEMLVEETRIEDKETRTNAMLLETQAVLDSTNALALRTAQDLQQQTGIANERSMRLDARELGIANTERNQQVRAQAQDQRERDLNDRETAINDRSQTLERNIKRNG